MYRLPRRACCACQVGHPRPPLHARRFFVSPKNPPAAGQGNVWDVCLSCGSMRYGLQSLFVFQRAKTIVYRFLCTRMECKYPPKKWRGQGRPCLILQFFKLQQPYRPPSRPLGFNCNAARVQPFVDVKITIRTSTNPCLCRVLPRVASSLLQPLISRWRTTSGFKIASGRGITSCPAHNNCCPPLLMSSHKHQGDPTRTYDSKLVF